MFNDFLESLRAALALKCENASVELFFRDISQYKYISQKPVILVQFCGVEFEKPLHSSFLSQKATLQVNFYYLTRTLDNAHSEGVFELFEDIRTIEGAVPQSLKAYSHKKNVSVWEIKTRIVKVF